MKRRLLAVFAHPDDESFICGGTLAKYAQSGVEITLVSATRGEMGRRMGNPPYVNRETMPAVREKELRQACAALGIHRLIFLDIRDKTVEFIDPESLTERIAALIKEVDPDVVLTFHEQLGGHPDHCAIGKAATAAFHRTSQKGSLYFITFGDAMAYPEQFGYTQNDVVKIDIRHQLEAKLAAFRAHRCQTEIDAWVWEPDHQALAKFGRYEYFLVGSSAAPQLVCDDLFPSTGA
ncbi:LmbE family protein [Xylanibacillus composti]|uniref:Bacillithiol biosynthesis deacetylase BshB2 n=1 Tax=Xylanibacillus composti TaxID=1572762 RepID=A0A8J4H7A2_9BACL|nr:PIG-L family deacetylase [Xylanibacillus composti]MDT9726927.1 LmbE family protein [Xylanibacillus composti]GIQ70103.1 bacillithiol biosynthesis deacetylase BshB2 [Xylanibacillus composti]